MFAPVGQSAFQARQGDETALRRVIERLGQQFPELDSDTVARAVQGRYHEIEESPVRDFIPVLVERAAREQLKTASANRLR